MLGFLNENMEISKETLGSPKNFVGSPIKICGFARNIWGL